MEIVKQIKVPTGDILIVKGERGSLEMLSIGDYGKDVNIKCDALGLSRIPDPVKHQQMLPLEEKWVITISTQYGCSMNCCFCDVPKVGPGRNATFNDLVNQVIVGLDLHPEVKSTKRLNIHFARMGEPTFNIDVLEAARWYKQHVDPIYKVHPVVSTMMPRCNSWLKPFLGEWMWIKNVLYDGNAGLQLSINSTDEDEREKMFGGRACTLQEIAQIMERMVPKGRKITLNFALAGWTIDPERLRSLFPPESYIVKLTPMHKTNTALEQGIKTAGDYTEYEPYADIEKQLCDVGYDVLVFIASKEEDESRITCGNAILSDKDAI